MKKQLLISGLVASIAASSFAQGTISFKTSITKDAVFYSTDGVTPVLMPTTGDFGQGTVNYEIYSAANGTAAVTGATPSQFLANLQANASWTGTAVGAVAYSAAGVVSPGITVTLGSGSGAGNPAEIEIVAYVGSLQNPSWLGFSGELFNGASSFTSGGITYSTGSSAWSQATGNPAPPTPTTPGTLTTGANGLGAIVLQQVPEPSTIALGGLGAASLLLFRRRK